MEDIIDIEILRGLCKSSAILWSQHAAVRILQRNISKDDIKYAILNGEIIEQYPTDYPYPSCLVLGITILKKYLHVVCAVGKEQIWIVTAYYPNTDEWNAEYRIRKEWEQ